MKQIRKAYTYDDVLLVPKYTEILPNEASLATKLADGIELKVPLVSAGMDTVTEWRLAAEIAQLGGIGLIHKSMSAAYQAEQVESVKDTPPREGAAVSADGRLLCGAAVGVTSDALDRIALLLEHGVDIIAVDTSHGFSKNVIEKVKEIKTRFPSLPLIAGNVATAAGARALIEAGADCVKVGIGPGSICTTRVVSGVGVPQLTAVMDCVDEAKKLGATIIADGGIKYSGDIVKALAAGADAVMLGSMFASAEEAPGDTIMINGVAHKSYRGMGSTSAMKSGSGDRYFQSETKKFVAEGVEGAVVCKGALADIVFQLVGGIRSGMGHNGARNLEELYERSEFVEISSAGLKESHPHDLAAIKDEPNYNKCD